MSLSALLTIDHLEVMGKVCSLPHSSCRCPTHRVVPRLVLRRDAERRLVAFAFTGAYGAVLLDHDRCNVPRSAGASGCDIRRSVPAVLAIALLINVGMCLERILIVVNTLTSGYAPAQWSSYVPTLWDWLLLAGTLGFFATLFLCFVRIVPVMSMHEVRRLASEVDGP